MKKLLAVLFTLTLLPVGAGAVTGGKPARDSDGLRRSVVRVENSLGELCTGVLIAPDVVLTAAHCLALPARYHAVVLDKRFRPHKIEITAMEKHAGFVAGQSPQQQTGVDIALARLARPAPADMEPTALADGYRIEPEMELYIAGYGSTSYNNVKSARTLRVTALTALAVRQPPNGLVFAADPARRARSSGSGACRGDSGGPVFIATATGYAVGGIISWSARAQSDRNPSPCGGVTAITPISPHAGWIARGVERLSASR